MDKSKGGQKSVHQPKKPSQKIVPGFLKAVQGLIRWLVIILVVFVILSGTSQLALMSELRVQPGNSQTNLDVDYQIWEFLSLGSIKPEIVQDIEKDQRLLNPSGFNILYQAVPNERFLSTRTPTADPLNPYSTPQTPAVTPGETQFPGTTATGSATPTATRAYPAGVSPFWFYNTSTPDHYMMYPSRPEGTMMSTSASVSFHTSSFEAGGALEAGLSQVQIRATNSGLGASSISAVITAGGVTIGTGSTEVPGLTLSPTLILINAQTSSAALANGEKIRITLNFASTVRVFWDGSYNDSRVLLPEITGFDSDSTPTATWTATATDSGTAPSCSLLTEVNHYTDDKVFYVVLRNNNDVYPTLTRSVLYWPDHGYDFHFVKFYFPYYDYFGTVYLNQYQYTSPVDSGQVNVPWPEDVRPQATWGARFVLDDTTTISGDFAADLTYTFPNGLVCTLRVGDEITVPTATPQPTQTPSRTPSPTRTSTSGSVPTATSTTASAPTATATNTQVSAPTPDCSLIREISHYHDDKVFYVTLRDDNGMYPNLVRSITYWPDSGYDFHFVKNYFPYYDYHGDVYYYENHYTSPVDSGAVNVTWPTDSRPSLEWAARFVLDDATTISGDFSAKLTFSFPSWGTCTITVGD
ncbi:MAG: hypothetical protein JXA25_01630 [Anaerolineales bacterium]|nr:hypothetical protein [Anaerolineales bacterium]